MSSLDTSIGRTATCDSCSQTLEFIHCYGTSKAGGCHESFDSWEAALIHKDGRTGGCRYPGNCGLIQNGREVYRNGYGFLQWPSWSLPKEKKEVG